MNLKFPNILNEGCKVICWCFPVELTESQWEEIRNTLAIRKSKNEIFLKEILSVEKNNLYYCARAGLWKIPRENKYLCSFRIEEVKSKEATTESAKSKISELFDFISKILKEEVRIIAKGIYEFDLTKVRPIFEIPFAFPGTVREKTSLGKGQVTGLTLNFEQSALGLKEAHLDIDQEENKLGIDVHCVNKFVVKPEMPIKITDYLRSVTQLFVEEVKK